MVTRCLVDEKHPEQSTYRILSASGPSEATTPREAKAAEASLN